MRRQAGFSLLETVLVIVLLGIVVAGLSSLFVSSVGKSHEPYLRQRALAVAGAFMDEIMAKRWDENTPLGGGCVNTGSGFCLSGPAAAGLATEEAARADWDDVDDYDAITAQSPPQDASGNPMPGHDGFSVTVNVSQPAGGWNGLPAADVKRIEVQVASNSGEQIVLHAWRVNF